MSRDLKLEPQADATNAAPKYRADVFAQGRPDSGHNAANTLSVETIRLERQVLPPPGNLKRLFVLTFDYRTPYRPVSLFLNRRILRIFC